MKITAYSVLLYIMLISCKYEQKSESTVSKQEEKVEYIYQDGDKEYLVKVDKTPHRAVLFKPYTTEMMLALGLEDRIVMAYTEGEVLPQFKEAYEKIPYKMIGHHANINREKFILMKPDFVSGFPSDIRAETTGSPEELIKSGVYPFLLQSLNIPNATLDDVFEDFLLLGKIFSVPDRADSLVSEMKNKLEKMNLQIQPEDKRKKVMVMASIDGGIWIYGSLVTDLINRANGYNVYNDVDTQYEFVSFESVLHRNPDVIFMVDVASRGVSIEEKKKVLRTDPVLKNINAVREGNLHTINIEDIYPSIRNVDFIIRMNDILQKQAKN